MCIFAPIHPIKRIRRVSISRALRRRDDYSGVITMCVGPRVSRLFAEKRKMIKHADIKSGRQRSGTAERYRAKRSVLEQNAQLNYRRDGASIKMRTAQRWGFTSGRLAIFREIDSGRYIYE